MSKLLAGFNLGDIVIHRVQKFRGVIVDVDADFQGSDDWYDQYTTNQPSKTAPWYHILVDEEGSMAYVSEQNIYVDSTDMEIEKGKYLSLVDLCLLFLLHLYN